MLSTCVCSFTFCAPLIIKVCSMLSVCAGYLVVRHRRVMLGERVRELYSDWLRGSVNKRRQVLLNLQLYLEHVEATLKGADNECEQ